MKTTLGLALVILTSHPLLAGEQWRTLADVPKEQRMNVSKEWAWPEQPGEAAVCLWKDDKTAAITYTIDDNNAMNIDWWLAEAGQRDIKLTWFLITDRIGKTNPAANADWAKWQAVRDAGHALESHTMTHLHIDQGEWQGIDWEYKDSQQQIRANITSPEAFTLAYPGGKNSSLNDQEVAKKYYIAARGGRATMNDAVDINYMEVCSSSATNFGTNPKTPWNDTTQILDPEGRAYRGWSSIHYHYIKPEPEAQDKTRADLDYYTQNSDKLWAATFPDCVRYTMERNTSQLETVENSSNRIVLNLADSMDDSIFTYPLTVKVRLPDGWNSFRAKQGDSELKTTVIEHDGAKYGLVDIVPDGGQAVLIPG